MKKILLLVNLVLLFSAWSAYRFYQTSPSKQDYSNYIKGVARNDKLTAEATPVRREISSAAVNTIIDSTPFDPQRGLSENSDVTEKKKPERTPVNKRKPNLKLTGICMVGGKTGAIIIDNSRGHRYTPPRRVRPIGRGRPVVHTPPKADTQPAKQTCYYHEGDKLSCGYTLKEIKRNSVVLIQGSSSFELEMESKENSKGGNSLPEKRIISQSGGSGKGRTPRVNRNKVKNNINNSRRYKR